VLTPAWPLETERLLIRPFEPRDLESMQAIHGDPRVVQWLYNDPRTPDEVGSLLERKIADAALAADGDWLSAAATLREGGALVGDLVMQLVSEEHRCVEVGYIIDPACAGQGFATEAAGAFVRMSFEQFGMHRVVGRVEPRNTGSVRVLEKLGMRREAHFVENEWVKGEWQSEFVFAILDREWRR
jgi:RimJ/RimL family protein N-acetyltransferase